MINQTFDAKPLSRYIEATSDQAYILKIAPNKVVFSRKYLELVG
jgi:hypothetical protein